MVTSLSNALGRLRKFLRKEYRDGYLENHVRGSIPLQIRALRKKAGMSQAEFATATDKKQSTISRLEDTDYGRVSVQTLLDVATAMDVALIVRFVDYPQFLRLSDDMSPTALAPANIHESQEALSQPPLRQETTDIISKLLAGQYLQGEASQKEARRAPRQNLLWDRDLSPPPFRKQLPQSDARTQLWN